MVKSFPARATPVTADLRVVEVMETAIPLCDVRSCRACGSEDLVPEAVALISRQSGNDLFSDEYSQRSTLLPAFQIFERFDHASFTWLHSPRVSRGRWKVDKQLQQ